MRQRSSRTNVTDERDAAIGGAGRSGRTAPPAVARVLDLQRLAGNGAVTRALQRQRGSAEFYAASLANENAGDANSFTAATAGVGTRAAGKGGGVRSAMAAATGGEHAPSQHPTMAQLGVPPEQVTGRALAAYVANRTYRGTGIRSLPGATRDATAMEQVMKGNRYTTKFSGRDYTGLQLGSSYRSVVESAAPGDGLFLYYAGHGWASGLIGVDATEARAAAVRKATLRYTDLLATVEAGVAKGVHLTLVLDACRSGAMTDLVRLKEVRRLGASTDERVKAVLSQIAHLRSFLGLVWTAPSVQKLWRDKIRPALLEVEPCVTTPGDPLSLPTTVSDANDVVQAVEHVITRLLDLAHRLEQAPPAPPPAAG